MLGYKFDLTGKIDWRRDPRSDYRWPDSFYSPHGHFQTTSPVDPSIQPLLLHKAYRAGMAFRPPNGRWPAIGDVDSARSIPVHHDDFWKFDSLCSVGAVLFDDPLLKVDTLGAWRFM